jgi:hypothetical protein
MFVSKLDRKWYSILYQIPDGICNLNAALFSGGEFRVLEPRIRSTGNVGTPPPCLAGKYAPEGKQKIHLGLGPALVPVG